MRRILFFILVVGFILMCWPGIAEQDDTLTNAVLYMIDKEPSHPKAGDFDYAAEIAAAMESAGEQYKIDPWLLVSMGHWESHYNPRIASLKKKGDAGEEGLLQCGKQCKASCDYFMDTIKGQILCGASWYAKADLACNAGEKEALTYYASGEVCVANLYRPKRCFDSDDPEACYKRAQGNLRAKVNRRLRLRNRLKNQFGA